MKRFARLISLASLLAAACASGPAHGRSRHPIGVQAVPRAAPYRVELVSDHGGSLPTYRHRGRTYVLGHPGQRYAVRVSNPTGQRIEAVISVDGLDAIDGRTADFAGKRGYIVPPYGEVLVDGFRVSLDDVATFRFSSVGASYAGRKGQARHVGVIGVAIFAERAAPQIALPPVPPPHHDDHWDHEDVHVRPHRAPAPPASKSAGDAPSATAPSAPTTRHGGDAAGAGCCSERRERPGLGTEFGERRGSPVTWVAFHRAHPTRPTAIAEVRYNDRDGLAALGIPVRQLPDDHELELRESASPFPGSGYASPPPGW